MKGKKILVTGGSGDLGNVLAPRILSAGASMISLDPEPSSQLGVESVRGSILDCSVLDELIASSDIVVHIAAWHGYHAFTRSKSTQEFWDLNMTGTFNLLEACARNDRKKFVFISSTSADEWPDVYGMTKVLGEELCRAYAMRHEMQILALRPRAFIPWWNKKVYSSKADWAAWFARGAVHINDVAQSVMLACNVIDTTPATFFDVIEIDGKHDFDAADREAWTKNGAKQFLRERFPRFSDTIEKATFLPVEPPSYKDSAKARSILGYEPTFGYEELLAEMGQFTLS